MLIILNFSSEDASADIGINITNAKLLLNNYKTVPIKNQNKNNISLRPYEVMVYKL